MDTRTQHTDPIYAVGGVLLVGAGLAFLALRGNGAPPGAGSSVAAAAPGASMVLPSLQPDSRTTIPAVN